MKTADLLYAQNWVEQFLTDKAAAGRDFRDWPACDWDRIPITNPFLARNQASSLVMDIWWCMCEPRDVAWSDRYELLDRGTQQLIR